MICTGPAARKRFTGIPARPGSLASIGAYTLVTYDSRADVSVCSRDAGGVSCSTVEWVSGLRSQRKSERDITKAIVVRVVIAVNGSRSSRGSPAYRALSANTHLTNCRVSEKAAASAGSRTAAAGLGRPSQARSIRADQAGRVAFAHLAPARFDP